MYLQYLISFSWFSCEHPNLFLWNRTAPTKRKLTKGGALRKRKTSYLASLHHSCLRNAYWYWEREQQVHKLDICFVGWAEGHGIFRPGATATGGSLNQSGTLSFTKLTLAGWELNTEGWDHFDWRPLWLGGNHFGWGPPWTRSTSK
jgi:hypothetical protein